MHGAGLITSYSAPRLLYMVTLRPPVTLGKIASMMKGHAHSVVRTRWMSSLNVLGALRAQPGVAADLQCSFVELREVQKRVPTVLLHIACAQLTQLGT